MANISSNLFDLYSDNIKPSTPKNDNLNFKKVGKIEMPTCNEQKGNILLTEAQKLLHSCGGYDQNIQFQEIQLDRKNFAENHFDLMNSKNLIVMYSDNTYKYLTNTGKVFIVKDKHLINTIQKVPIPHKISIDYIPTVDNENIISLQLITRVLFNLYIDNPIDLISLYLKSTVPVNKANEYSIAYHLFSIYGKIDYLLTSRHYWKYIFMEQNIYNIQNACLSFKPISNPDSLSAIKQKYIDKVTPILQKLNIDIQTTCSKDTLLSYIYDNLDIYPTINTTILHLLGNTEEEQLIKNINILNYLNMVSVSNSFPPIKTVSSIGDIGRGTIIPINLSDRVLLRGSFSDMFFKIFTHVTYNRTLQCPNDETLIYSLIKDKVDNSKKLYAYYIEYYIRALSLGYTKTEDILDYFKTHLYTILSEEDLLSITDIYNNKLSDIKDTIDKYNFIQYCSNSPSLLNHKKLDPLSIAIYDKKRLIMKDLINEINLYCKDFNTRNKHKMDIAYFDSDNIYLLADEEALNTAFDTLSRVMPEIFNKYCPKVSPTCTVEVIPTE